MTDTLNDELASIRRYQGHPPPNEACTCEWVIVPLLWRLGYERHEILSRVSDTAGKYPDYTILPETPHTWYLEAKEWQRELRDDQDVVQATTYAYQNGRRWVVLSNGREWRLYDATVVSGDTRQRLVDAARLEDEAALKRLLHALSKRSVLDGGLERYALHSRLSAVLREELTADDSQTLRVIRKVLKRIPGLSELQTRHLAGFFKGLFCPAPGGIVNPPELIPAPSADKSASPGAPGPEPGPEPPDRLFTLGELVEMRTDISGKCPHRLSFPDGGAATVATWKELGVAIVGWLGERERLPPLPFHPGRCRRCLLNSNPRHPDGTEMRSHHRFEFNGRVVYLNVHHAAAAWVRHLQTLCLAVGESPAGFRVTLRQ